MRPGALKALALVLPAVLAAGGCMKHHDVSPEDFERYWSLHHDPTGPDTLRPVSIGGRKYPARWIIRQIADEKEANESIERAIKALEAGPDQIEFGVSPAHARQVAEMLAEIRGGIEALKPLMEDESRKSPDEWAGLMAGALRRMEHLIRTATGEEVKSDTGSPLGAPSSPMLQMLVAYLNTHARGGLLAGMSGREVNQLRQVLVQVVVRLGFASAGKSESPAVRQTVSALMRDTRDLAELEKSLAGLLEGEFETAPPAPPDSQLPGLVHVGFKALPKALQVLETLAGQWDRVRVVTLELHRQGSSRMAMGIVDVLPGKEVRLDGMLPMMAQPAIVLKGRSRATVIPSVRQTGETVLLFEPDGKVPGSVQIRFEGPVYAMVRAFVLPLASGALREVRVFTKMRGHGTQLINVAVAMRADNDKDDPRRLLLFQDIQTKRIERDVASVRSTVRTRDLIVNYLTPTRRYVYRRVKEAADEP